MTHHNLQVDTHHNLKTRPPPLLDLGAEELGVLHRLLGVVDRARANDDKEAVEGVSSAHNLRCCPAPGGDRLGSSWGNGKLMAKELGGDEGVVLLSATCSQKQSVGAGRSRDARLIENSVLPTTSTASTFFSSQQLTPVTLSSSRGRKRSGELEATGMVLFLVWGDVINS